MREKLDRGAAGGSLVDQDDAESSHNEVDMASFKEVQPCRDTDDRKAKLSKFEHCQFFFKFLCYIP